MATQNNKVEWMEQKQECAPPVEFFEIKGNDIFKVTQRDVLVTNKIRVLEYERVGQNVVESATLSQMNTRFNLFNTAVPQVSLSPQSTNSPFFAEHAAFQNLPSESMDTTISAASEMSSFATNASTQT
ncbi:uncharacterized protein LOC119687190 [Teleopsis dalmanni]|uniref:uncharacterized protein LOC119687190 n=1 Tax=Teleopsis dalmanni TaxID=139649 RepID=UPI0018CF0FD8|nr:uncharacterized protein LOC119687190 [Teleopsis dalmanni]